MNILPTKGEYKILRSCKDKLETICSPGKKCESCFLNTRLDGESCCPVSHIISITEDLTNELIEKILSSLDEIDGKEAVKCSTD